MLHKIPVCSWFELPEYGADGISREPHRLDFGLSSRLLLELSPMGVTSVTQQESQSSYKSIAR